MSEFFQPSTAAELAEAVCAAPRVLAVGGGTKPRLSAVPGAARISTTRLTGILEYDPCEFTFTAQAGTSLREIASTLLAQGQYLPFDPPFVAAGATIGGTVGAGLSGAGRFRFGGLRDFILGIRFVDGEGRLLRMGGKVVKNAAGFDLAKFFVGSLGRFGILAEVTFKVFPRPAALLTLELPVSGLDALLRLLAEAGSGRWELDALEASLDRHVVYARLGGSAAAVEALAEDILGHWPGRRLAAGDADLLWQSAREFGWASAGQAVMKIPLAPSQIPRLARILGALPDSAHRIGAGGNVAYLAVSPAWATEADRQLRAEGFTALSLRGEVPLWLGASRPAAIYRAVKQALDPRERFPALEN